MHPALQPRLLSLSRTLTKSPCRIICNRRYPSIPRSFHRSRRLQTGQPYGAPPTGNGEDQQQGTEDSDPSEPIAESEGVSNTEEKRDLRHYGSATRRQQRGRLTKEPWPPIELPTWFSEFNVHLSGEFPVPGTPWPTMMLGIQSRSLSVAVQKRADILFDQPHKGSMPSKHEDYEDIAARQYLIDNYQWTELLFLARGLMKHPLPFFETSANEKNHLLLHSPIPGSSSFFDGLIKAVAYTMVSDLIVLDAQDIAELVTTTEYYDKPSEELLQAARHLSYDVYHREPVAPAQTPGDDGDFMDEDHPNETSLPRGPYPLPPRIFAKPIAINLPDLFGSYSKALTKRGRSVSRPFLSELTGDETPQSKTNKRPFSSLIDSILSGPASKRTRAGVPTDQEPTPHPTESFKRWLEAKGWMVGGLVIHIKDLTAIQDTPFGSRFLTALYENVQSRRMAREKIIIIGTRESGDDSRTYSQSQIREIEEGDSEEISKTIVISPVVDDELPNAINVYQSDKRRRTRIINMRNLWEMLRRKNSEALTELPDGFWQLDIKSSNHHLLSKLGESVWSFTDIHRLSTAILGYAGEEDRPLTIEDISTAFDILDVSERNKVRFANKGRSTTSMEPLMQEEGARERSLPLAVEVTSDQRLSFLRRSGTKHEKKLLAGVIEPKDIKTTFADVHAPAETVEALKTLTSLSLIRPDAFLYGVLASDRIPGLMLYGPPGTGKTLLAKAVAKESGATVLQVSGAELNDMYVGEGEKNVKALFSVARKLMPCVLFIDEVDSLFSARAHGRQRASHREILNQFLKEWDGMSNDSGSAFIMVATNRPMDLDDAVLRRLPRRLLVDLPTENDRLEILKIHLREEQLAEDVNLASLASRTPFYSGSDLKNLSVAAALSCVKEENDAAKRYAERHEGGEDVPEYKYDAKRTLTAKHFERALEEISASISEDMNSLKDIRKFDEQYGDKKGKKKSKHWGFETAAQANQIHDTVKVRA